MSSENTDFTTGGTVVNFVEEYHTEDKSAWGDGEWSTEPDKAVWVDEATDLDCLIVRGPSGALCGYVGVPEGHPWFGKGYSECLNGCEYDDESHSCYDEGDRPDFRTDVHGGLTFSGPCREDPDPSRHICHLPQAGRPQKVWWFGFDCAHAFDVAPLHRSRDLVRYEKARAEGDAEGMRLWSPSWTDPRETYRDLRYVVDEVTSLAQQLAKVA